MNTDANSQNNALLNRMILLVLSLILVCLVLLVVRAYIAPSSASRTTSMAETPEAQEPITASGNPMPATAPTRTAPNVPRPPSRMVSRVTGAGEDRQSPPTSSDFTPPAAEQLPPVTRIDAAVVGAPPVVVGNPGFPSDLATAEVLGVATLVGQPPAEIAIPLTPTCGRLAQNKKPTTRHYVVNSEGRLANVFVYIHGLNSNFRPSSTPAVLDQIGCMYQPYVLGAQTGQPFQVQNSDNEAHNVHVMPRIDSERNFMELKGQVKTFTFDNPDVFVRVKCDVHPWMFAYVGVCIHPFFAVTDTNGVFHLPKGLPAGHYTLLASHQKAGRLSQEIDFHPGEQSTAFFQFTVPGKTQARNTP